MKVNVVVPQLGPNMFEATVVTWLKEVGSSVQKGEALAEVMTDKVNIDVEAPATGTLVEIFAKAGESMEVEGLMGVIEAAGDD
jgi:pyruvate/2-oxoglutarate dehydrogenase complex dihydrolipoamide acyltransferase (E2) component